MRFALEPISGPEVEPIDITRMKRELGEFADLTELDDDISDKIVAGREWVESFTGRILVDQTWRLTIDQADRIDMLAGVSPTTTCGTFYWNRRVGEALLRKSPVLAITSMATVDADGDETAVSDTEYELREQKGRWPKVVPLTGASWTSASLIRITFRAGYVDRTSSPQQDVTLIPERFKQAIILYVKSLYDNQPEAMKVAESLIRGERVELGLA